jgi:hypothetical protein
MFQFIESTPVYMPFGNDVKEDQLPGCALTVCTTNEGRQAGRCNEKGATLLRPLSSFWNLCGDFFRL